jgi:hypothetical protein
MQITYYPYYPITYFLSVGENMNRKILCGIISCFIILILISNPPLYSQGKGGSWHFENNGFDTADWDALDDNGELQGLAAYNNAEPLQEGIAYLWLDSANKYDFFKITDSNDLDFDNENIGISAWIYPLVVGDDVHWILNKGDQFPNPKTTNYSLRISKTKKLEFLIRDANNQAKSIASSFDIPINQWTFVAIFYDFGAGKVYIWNELTPNPIDTLDFNQSFFSNSDPLAIGSWYTSDPATPSIKDFEGRIDDVRISGRLEDILSAPSAVQYRDGNPEVMMPNEIAIYPNPVSISQGAESVTFQFNSYQAWDQTIHIFDILGREVFSGSISNQVSLFKWNLKDRFNNPMQSGIYFLRINTNDKFHVKKFLVIK